MKLYLYLVLLYSLLFVACGKQQSAYADLQALYAELDNEIENSKDYEIAKESRIARLHNEYDISTNKHRRTEIINQLIHEFDAYNADSTLYYISLNLSRPAILNNPGEYTKLTIKRADVMAHAGLFQDALAILGQIPRDSLNESNLEAYYSTYCATYQYLSEYTAGHKTEIDHEKMRTLYADSLRQAISPYSFNYMVYITAEQARKGDSKSAIQTLTSHLKEYNSGTREFSILASTLAYIYKTAGMQKEYKRYIVLSAISDVKGAVKENMSFREVATFMFEDGDIERANRYLKKSIADANFYSALIRNAQSSKMLPVIDEAYAAKQEQLNQRLHTMAWTSSILAIILAITTLFTIKQFKSLRKANSVVNRANEELSSLSEQLKTANAELQHKNIELRDYNKTKEQYAGLFMEYCSSAISILQRYQQSLRVTAQSGNRATLLNKLESTAISDQLLKNFYIKFDEAILNIYPSFVDKFNTLLKPDEQIILKSGELLNTELRLFALIRLGIDDSAKIAEFLRCSLATVYTYRSKMKKRAINPDCLENDVRNMA